MELEPMSITAILSDGWRSAEGRRWTVKVMMKCSSENPLPGLKDQTWRDARAGGGAAASRQARIGHEICVRAEGVLINYDAMVDAVGCQVPALRLVLQVGDHDLVEDLLVDRWIFDRHQRFDPAVEVPRHPVRRGNEDLGLRRGQAMAVAEADHPAVLQE